VAVLVAVGQAALHTQVAPADPEAVEQVVQQQQVVWRTLQQLVDSLLTEMQVPLEDQILTKAAAVVVQELQVPFVTVETAELFGE
jgi:phosphohistidine swiveling domain-containing protein